MQVYRDIEAVGGALRGCAVTIGNFDGVHLGHQALLAEARRLAGERPSVVLTFEPHPAKVLSPEFAPLLLTPPARKTERLAAFGMDAEVVLRFDRAFAANSPERFVERYLIEGLGARHVVVGYDFSFGKGRAGNPEVLARLGEGAFEVHTVEPVREEGLVVSSSKIRELLLEGRVGPAARLLGHPFLLDGTVVRGRGRGRGIGFPTANVASETELVPANGVYTVLCAVEGVEGPVGGAANVGRKPTFGEEERTVEVNLFGEFDDLYDRRISVAFLHRLRAEVRFASVDELVAQIREDVRQAKAQLEAWKGAAPVLVPPSNF